ncbi:MAG: substrate-binding domain-containing protein [Chloroflexota bacterium]|nr:substrate-binding domain-containing protein [Chloroflexota bacterium]
MIGLVVSTIENVFFTEVARAAEQTAHGYGYNLIVCNTDENPAQENIYLSLLDRQLVAGIILAPAPGDAEHLHPFVQSGLPIVLINRRLQHLSLPSITCDDTEASRQCVGQLIREGRKRIAAITGLDRISTTQDRLEGYRLALRDANLPVDPTLERSGQATFEGGYRAMYKLLQHDPQPDAVFVFNNVMTQGAVMACQDVGLQWPGDIDIAGFGAFQTARLYRPPLTLIEQPARTMGERAVMLLIDQVERRGTAQPHIVLPNRCILRAEWTSRPIRVTSP